jgi:hypothetical protein
MIDINIEQELQDELIENEKLVWTGRPSNVLAFKTKDLLLIPFSLIWFVMMIGIAIAGRANIQLLPALLVCIPFLVMGLYAVAGRFIFDSKRRANTNYGITDNRVIIRSGIISKTTNSFNIKTMQDITITEKSKGRGTIMFGRNNFRLEMMHGMALIANKETPCFEQIGDVKSVYSLIIKMQID